MDCPKCGNKMKLGEIASLTGRGDRQFWAEKDFFQKKIVNFYTKKSVEKEGGIVIPSPAGMLTNRTVGYACRECKLILIDCN